MFDNNILRKCFRSCKTCNGSLEINTEMNIEKHNCLECAENYYNLPDGSYPNNCYDNQSINSWKIKEETSWVDYITETSYKIKDTTSNVTEITFNIQNLTSNIQDSTYNVKDTISNIKYSPYISEYITTSYIQETTFNNKEYVTPDIKDSIYNKEYTTYDVRNYTDKIEETNTNIVETLWKKEYTTWNKLDTSWNKEYKTLTTNNICYTTCLNCDVGPIIDTNTGNIINHNCLKCKEGYYLKKDTKNCYNNETIESGYYLDINIFPHIWKECYKKCSACETLGNATNMNCLSCNLNLINEQTLKKYNFKLTENGNCIEECEDNLFLTSLGDCVSECPKGTFQYSLNQTCLQSCPNNYEINKEQNKCILKTVDQTISYTEFKSQITKNITDYLNSSTFINGSDFIAVIFSSDNTDPKEQLKKGISAIDLGNCTQTIKDHYNISNEESLIILNMESKRNESKEEKNDNDKSFELGKNIQVEIYDMAGRKLDLSACKENIKVMKYIGDVEELNINSAMSLAEKGIDVFNASHEFFNDICHNYNNTDGIDIIIEDRRSDLYQNVSFCQEGCTYTGMNYELMTANCICDSSMLQKDLNNNTENENSKEEKLSFNSMKDSFLESLFPFNLDVIHCYNLVINLKILKNNIGFYFMLSMLILQIIFLIIYLSKKLKPVRYFMLIFKKKINDNIQAFPPLKNNIINKKEKKKFDNTKQNQYIKSKFVSNNKTIKSNLKNKKTESNIIIEDEPNNKKKSNIKRKIKFSDNENNPDTLINNQKNDLLNLNPSFSHTKLNEDKNSIFSQNQKIQNILTKNLAPIINIQTPILNNYDKKQTKKLRSESECRDDKILKKKSKSKKLLKGSRPLKNDSSKKSIFNKSNKSSNSKALINMETTGNKKEENKDDTNVQDLIRLSKTDEDLQDMDYEQAITQDKRSYLRMYWAFLVDTQIILGTFCTENYLNLMVIKLSFLVCTFQISFFLNAFFYVDEYISDAYHNDGVLDFISGLPKAIYSFVATLITTNLLRMLSNSKSELMKLIREKRKKNNYIELINIKLEKLKKKLIIYFICVFLLGLFFLYYVSAFCAVYRNSQKYWFIGCLESFGIDSLVAIIICIVLSFFRYIAIKNHLKCFYILANIISIFL